MWLRAGQRHLRSFLIIKTCFFRCLNLNIWSYRNGLLLWLRSWSVMIIIYSMLWSWLSGACSVLIFLLIIITTFSDDWSMAIDKPTSYHCQSVRLYDEFRYNAILKKITMSIVRMLECEYLKITNIWLFPNSKRNEKMRANADLVILSKLKTRTNIKCCEEQKN